jgi:hypothetical protein
MEKNFHDVLLSKGKNPKSTHHALEKIIENYYELKNFIFNP